MPATLRDITVDELSLVDQKRPELGAALAKTEQRRGAALRPSEAPQNRVGSTIGREDWSDVDEALDQAKKDEQRLPPYYRDTLLPDRSIVTAMLFEVAGTRAPVIRHIKRRARALGRTDLIPDIWKSGETQTFSRSVSFWKDDAKRIVYGVALQPHLVDSQGHTVTPEEVEAAAHDFLSNSRVIGVQHDREIDAEVVESFVTQADMEVAGQTVLQGSWVLGVKLNDDNAWEGVLSGDLTGFSIGGTGILDAVV